MGIPILIAKDKTGRKVSIPAIKGEKGSPGVHIAGDGERPDETYIELNFSGDDIRELLPSVTDKDNGKIISVVGGAWKLIEQHTHENKNVLDKLGQGSTAIGGIGDDEDAFLTFNGKPIRGIETLDIQIDEETNWASISCMQFIKELNGYALMSWEIPIVPAVSEEDNGKILRVVEGIWKPSAIQNAEEVAF